MQEAGQAMYLLAWRGGELAGRCTVLTASKYEKVRHLLGAFPEMNALEASTNATSWRGRWPAPSRRPRHLERR